MADYINRDAALAEIEFYRKDWADARDAIAALPAAQMNTLVDLLREANADLKYHINTDWPPVMRDVFPDMQRIWELDMALCYKIDAALRAIEEDKG